jgi:hypothetical protein
MHACLYPAEEAGFAAPVAALVALLGGGYADEARTGGTTQLAVVCAGGRVVVPGDLGVVP